MKESETSPTTTLPYASDSTVAATNPLRVESHPPGFRWRRGRNWFFLGLLYAGYYLCRYNLGTVTPEMAKELNLSNQQTGWLSTGRDVGYAAGTFINGLFSDALGGKQSMAIGAIGTILLNLLFVGTVDSGIIWLITALVIIRTFDGYVQGFGSPGMVKINTSWFQRRERGKFAGIFGGMIQLGQIGVNQLSNILIAGFSLTMFGVTFFSFSSQNWRLMFIIPPAILAVILVLAWFNVKNHPEETGYSIPHDDDAHRDKPGERLPILYVMKVILSNPLTWVNAGAYFSTGFVRRAYDFWWVKYLANDWNIGKGSTALVTLGFLLPLSGFLGSFGSGWISDTFFRGKRSPVAAVLYGIETVVILGAFLVLGVFKIGSPVVACTFLVLISLTCNSSHSIIGTAAVMDIGGRKMAGFALGVVNSFQYWGSMLAGWFLGSLIDVYGWKALFGAMLPFSAFGMILMLLLAIRTRGRDVKGA